MTYNLDDGSDFDPLLAVTSAPQIPAAVSAVLAEVQASDIPDRAVALAAEIARRHPDLLGLQEATLWTVNGTPRFDILGSLLNALKADGQTYTVAVRSPAFAGALPDALGEVVGVQDSNVILARADLPPGFLRLSNPQAGQFAAEISLPIPGLRSLPIPRSWASVDVEMRGERFRFVTAHLEVSELLNGPADTNLPVVMTGDFNADSGSPTYNDVIEAGFQDTWTHTHPGDSGFTCCQDDLANSNLSLQERIDFIFSRGAVAESASLVGNNPAERMSNGLWPSDHLGVIGALDFG